MIAGFEFRETMAGSYRLVGAEHDRPISFTIRARTASLPRFVRRPVAEIEGEIDAQGFADHRVLRGTLAMDVLRDRTLAYFFRFADNEGVPRVFDGRKNLELGSLVESMTVLPGSILDEAGALVASAVLRFDLRSDLVRFLRSFRAQRFVRESRA